MVELDWRSCYWPIECTTKRRIECVWRGAQDNSAGACCTQPADVLSVADRDRRLRDARCVPDGQRPYSKLTRLCEVAASRGGALKSFVAVARAIELSPGRVTQLFGYGRDHDGTPIKPETLGRLVEAFAADGVCCEVAWLHLPFDDFADALTAANPATGRTPRRTVASDAAAPGWRFTEDSMLPDLVELRLHPPRPGNELADSFYVDATLLFGTAEHDVPPEDGSDPRSVAIALRKALLAIGSSSYQPLKDSMLGERTSSDHYRRVAGGVEITGPAPEGTLEGDPIGGDHLAVIAGTGTGDEPFSVSVAANGVASSSRTPTHRRLCRREPAFREQGRHPQCADPQACGEGRPRPSGAGARDDAAAAAGRRRSAMRPPRLLLSPVCNAPDRRGAGRTGRRVRRPGAGGRPGPGARLSRRGAGRGGFRHRRSERVRFFRRRFSGS